MENAIAKAEQGDYRPLARYAWSDARHAVETRLDALSLVISDQAAGIRVVYDDDGHSVVKGTFKLTNARVVDSDEADRYYNLLAVIQHMV